MRIRFFTKYKFDYKKHSVDLIDEGFNSLLNVNTWNMLFANTDKSFNSPAYLTYNYNFYSRKFKQWL